MILAVGVAGIAATGAYLGAGLKEDSQKRKVRLPIRATNLSRHSFGGT